MASSIKVSGIEIAQESPVGMTYLLQGGYLCVSQD